MTTQIEAVDIMTTRFIHTWYNALQNAPTVHSYYLENEVGDEFSEAPWARFFTRHGAGGQTAFAGVRGGKYEYNGAFFAHLYFNEGCGSREAIELGEKIKRGFSGPTLRAAAPQSYLSAFNEQPGYMLTVEGNKALGNAGSNVLFSGVDLQEEGNDGQWYLVIVSGEFEYYQSRR